MRAWALCGLALVACGDDAATTPPEGTDPDAGSESRGETDRSTDYELDATETDETEIAESDTTDSDQATDGPPGPDNSVAPEGGTMTTESEPDAGAGGLDAGGPPDASDNAGRFDASSRVPDAGVAGGSQQDAALALNEDASSIGASGGEWIVCEGSVSGELESGTIVTPGECALENYQIHFTEPVDYLLEVYISEFGVLTSDLATGEANLRITYTTNCASCLGSELPACLRNSSSPSQPLDADPEATWTVTLDLETYDVTIRYWDSTLESGGQTWIELCSGAPPTECGNGLVEIGEECDDGNADEDDGCTTTCFVSACGDGIVQEAEECDDGNLIDTDACTSYCLNAECGDGFLQDGEQCDNGASNSDTAGNACRTNCVPPLCGDGVVDSVNGETCDEGEENGPGGTCSSVCTQP